MVVSSHHSTTNNNKKMDKYDSVENFEYNVDNDDILQDIDQDDESLKNTDEFGNSLLQLSILAKMPKLFDELLSFPGTNIDYVNSDGNTALHIAAICSDHEKIEKLLSKGANCIIRNKHGFTPIQASLCMGFDECSDVFRKHLSKELCEELQLD